MYSNSNFTKSCSKCGREKDSSQFRRQSKAPDGLKQYCRDCDDTIARTRYQVKREYLLGLSKAYQAKKKISKTN